MEEYKTTNNPKGIALIFDNEIFSSSLQLQRRRGTECDYDTVCKTFYDLDFIIISNKNLLKKDVLKKIKEVSSMNHDNYDCFVCVFMSHGDNGVVYTYDSTLSIDSILVEFKGNNCKSLLSKPKIFIFQSCRGGDLDISIKVIDEVDDGFRGGPKETISSYSDILICYSTFDNFCSFREVKRGSWYIQELCQNINTYKNELDFIDILTKTNKTLSLKESSSLNINVVYKQMSCFLSMLTKKLFLKDSKKT